MEFHSGNRWLTDSEMKDNGRYIATKLQYVYEWTPQAICGVLGNMQTESKCNPAIWQNLDVGNLDLGYGLVQWTPATKYLEWATARGLEVGHMDSQLARIQYEVENNIQWIHPSMTFLEFTKSELTPYELAVLFLHHYERPAEPNDAQRGGQGANWYEYLYNGDNPILPPPPKKEVEIFLLHKHKSMRKRVR